MATKTLEERIKFLEKEVQRLHDIQEIQNLVGKYEVLHTPKTFGQTMYLFALKQPDVSAEIADWGVYIGAEQIKVLYGMVHSEKLEGTMFEHQLTTPMIEVAGDGKTAKGVWFSPGHETHEVDGKMQAFWCYGKYGADFIKEDGEWKIWHWHWYDTFKTPYHKSWIEVPPGAPPATLAEHPADKPTTYRSSYFPDGVREPIPGCPEPYQTWDGKSMA